MKRSNTVSDLKRERDSAMTAAVLNMETVNVQRREFQQQVSDLCAQLGSVRKELRTLRNQICSTIVELPREKYASVETILAFPQECGAHERCSVESCNVYEPHSHDGRRS